MTYLNSVSIQKGTKEFDIPFDRRQLADYLNLERTALSKELGKMQKEGILSVKTNHFQIHITQDNKW
ncbi:MAG: helix-turn-helix domain-containing protein, partial [Peptoniphilaceae bacterium]|nr:helix-turn-helix domain-containing protein [Peptoniphilaceae bacterium]